MKFLQKIKVFLCAKVWPWIKRNPWRAIAFVLGALGSIVFLFLRRGSVVAPQPDSTKEMDKAAKDREAEEAKHDKQLADVTKRAKEETQRASEEQAHEAATVQAKPAEEVAKWIDKIS